nr:hypothetical protein [Modestobacter versicolor]
MAGCGNDSPAAITSPPTCPVGDDGAGNGVILMAQSVPTAAWVPCVQSSLPLGWGFSHLDARDGEARFWLDSDRDGVHAVEVRLEGSCDTEGTTEIASDRDDMRRYERVRQVSPTYSGERHYVFPGGCLTVAFRLDGDSPGEALALASQAVDAVSRAELRTQVHVDSGGRVDLDPGRGDG